jgi:CubicO group peptidase (beta-lactamase class C family)
MGDGLSEAGLRRLHEAMDGHVRGGVPGLVAAVSRKGAVHEEVLGVRGTNDSDPISRDTIFRISSMTKPVIAAAAMTMVEDGNLKLDDSVDGLLPELARRRVLKSLESPLDETVPAVRPITLRDLLTFTFGLGIVMAPPGSYPIQKAMDELQLGQGPPHPASAPPPAEWMRRLGTLPLIHQPGAGWMYNTGADVLGVLLSRASGKPLESMLRDRILGPLGMKDTGFSVPPSKMGRFTDLYWSDPQTGRLMLYDRGAGGEWSRPPAFPSGGGGLVSTLDDYLAFGQMMLNKGKLGDARVLARRSVELMTSDQLTRAQKAAAGMISGYFENHGWGFGVSVVTKAGGFDGSVGSFGWNGGLGSIWVSDPKEEMVSIMLSHGAWGSPTPPPAFRDFLTLAYQAIA